MNGDPKTDGICEADAPAELLRARAEKAEVQVATLARYADVFEHVSEGITILDQAGAVVSLNPAAAQCLGISSAEVKGCLFATFAHPSREAAMMEMLARLQRGVACRNVDVEVRARDGRAIVLSVSGSPSPGGPGCILSFRDVTDARAMERELRKTKEFLEKLIDSSVEGIMACDMRGEIIVYNRSAERILGWMHTEVVEKINVRQVYPEGMAKKMMALMRSPEHGGVGRLEPTRTEVLSKEGERVPILMSAALIYEGDKAVASVGVFSDLRERTQLEAKLTRVQERLQEAEKQSVIVELAGTAAHELNQPLTSVMGYAELLKRKLKESDHAYKPVDIIYREAERMAEIVRKIGKITRYKTKAYVGNSRIVDLDRAAGDDE